MITNENTYKLINECVDSLIRSGSIDPIENFSRDTVILGGGSVLDSISFVTFITEVEDRIQSETGEEFYLVLNEIDAFNINNPNLTIGVLSDYISATIK
jgi:alcohol dehydrogenase class IV